MKAMFYLRFFESKINPKHHLVCRKLYLLKFECSQSWYFLEMESNYEISKIWLSRFELTFSDFDKSKLELFLTLFRIQAAHGWGSVQKSPSSLKSVTYILQWLKSDNYTLYKKDPGNIYITWNTYLVLLNQHFFSEN